MRYIARNKARLWRIKLVQNRPSGAIAVPANTPVTLWLSLTDGGAAIPGVAVLALARSGTNDKIWTGQHTMAQINTLLAGLADGATIYIVVSVAGEIDSSPAIVQFISRIE